MSKSANRWKSPTSTGCVGWNRVMTLVQDEPQTDPIRWELVRRVQAEIAAGTYDTEENWALAQEALFQQIEDREATGTFE